MLTVTSVVLLTADWYLECTSPRGMRLGGIDCFQYDALPKTNTTPTNRIGFVPLLALWVAGFGTAVYAGTRMLLEAHGASRGLERRA